MSDDYRSRVRDADFKTQYDSVRPDPQVEALLAGIEPEKTPEFVPQRHEPRSVSAPQFTWMKPLR